MTQKNILRWPFQNKSNYNILEIVSWGGLLFLSMIFVIAAFSDIRILSTSIFVLCAVLYIAHEFWRILSYLDLKKNFQYAFWDEEGKQSS